MSARVREGVLEIRLMHLETTYSRGLALRWSDPAQDGSRENLSEHLQTRHVPAGYSLGPTWTMSMTARSDGAKGKDKTGFLRAGRPTATVRALAHRVCERHTDP